MNKDFPSQPPDSGAQQQNPSPDAPRQAAAPAQGEPYRGRYARQSRSGLLLTAALMVFFCALGIYAVRGILRDRSRQGDYQDLARGVHAAQGGIAPSQPSDPQSLPGQEAPAPDAPAQPSEPAPTAPEETEPPAVLPQYAQLYEQNPDMFGWVSIPDTVVDYPVMYTPEDPEKYLHRSFWGDNSAQGTPFMDAGCDSSSDNYIIYGHNMKDDSMFRMLLYYERESYWRKHPVVRFDTLYAQGEYQVMAAFYDRVYHPSETAFKFYEFKNAASAEEFDRAVRSYKEKSIYDTGVTAAYGDRLLTLVTCAYQTENGRFVLVARKAAGEIDG